MDLNRVRFDHFEADLASGQLYKSGVKLHLQEQPFQVLASLLERPGEIVSREELRARVWSGDTFVDFDHSLNVAMNKIREVLGDSASRPRYIETVPRRGYRFIGTLAPSAPASVPKAPPGRRTYILVALAFTVLAAIAVRLWQDDPAPLLATPLTSETGLEGEPALSPDGAHVAYVFDPDGQTRYDLFIRPLSGGPPRRLTSTDVSERSPAWSPDGRLLAFVRSGASPSIVLIPALGGPERLLLPLPLTERTFAENIRLLAWFPDSKRLAFTGIRDGRMAIGAIHIDTGQQRWLTDPPPFHHDVDPAVSSSGANLAFVRYNQYRYANSKIIVGDLSESGLTGTRDLTSDDLRHSHPAWVPGNREILYAAGRQHFRQLYRIAISGGRPRSLALPGVSSVWPVIAGSRLLYHTGMFDVNMWRTPLQRGIASGPAVKIAVSNYIDHMPEFSPDGRKLAFISNRSGFQELWLSSAAGEEPLQLTSFREKEVIKPSWSPSGHMIGFTSAGSAFLVSPAGSPPQLLIGNGGEPSFSADGTAILFSGAANGFRISRSAFSGHTLTGKPELLSSEPGTSHRQSPDGRWIYYTSGSQGATLWRFPAGGGKESRVLDSLVNQGCWTLTRDGIWFIPLPAPGGAMSIHWRNPDTGATRIVAPVARLPMWGLAVCPDGSCVVHTQADRFETDLMMVEDFR